MTGEAIDFLRKFLFHIQGVGKGSSPNTFGECDLFE
jgi:hypothetical protein